MGSRNKKGVLNFHIDWGPSVSDLYPIKLAILDSEPEVKKV